MDLFSFFSVYFFCDPLRLFAANLPEFMMSSMVPLPPLIVELPVVPDVMAAVRAFADWPAFLLLDSAATSSPRGRYSFLTADPRQLVKQATATYGVDPFASFPTATKNCPIEPIAGLPPFQGGIAGLMGYELGHAWEKIPTPAIDEFQLPVLAAGLYDWVLAWDHHQRRAWIIVQAWPTDDAVTDEARIATAERRLNSLQERLSRPPAACDAQAILARPRETLAARHRVMEAPPVWSNFSADEYLAALQRIIDYIHAGDIFQANLSQRLLTPAPCGPIALYERLRKSNPAPFAGLFLCDDWAVISASPERFLHVENGQVVTRPIKGTRRRNAAPEADLFSKDELRESEKDQAENVMIVDLLRNDLSRVCLPGSVRVPLLCEVETYATVQHLVSEVCGTLRPGVTVWDLFAATSPGGSISGAPKVRAMEIIAELEPTVRGPYTGSLFYATTPQQADSNLLIRTFVMKYGWLQCSVGGGIVAQSDPAAEYAETWHKAAGMLRALSTPDDLEQRRVTNEK